MLDTAHVAKNTFTNEPEEQPPELTHCSPDNSINCLGLIANNLKWLPYMCYNQFLALVRGARLPLSSELQRIDAISWVIFVYLYYGIDKIIYSHT